MSLFFENDTDDMYDYFPGEFIYGDNEYVSDDYMGEKWWYTGVPGYMVSDCGRVWSEKSQKFLKLKDLDDHGHLGVGLSNGSINGKKNVRYAYIHRLVGEAFLPNQNNLPVVRHLDDVPSIIFLYYLAWGTQKEIIEDAKRNGKTFRAAPEVRARLAIEQSIPIVCVNTSTGERTVFSGQNEAARKLGLQQANIWKVLNGQRHHTCGYYFEYLGEDE